MALWWVLMDKYIEFHKEKGRGLLGYGKFALQWGSQYQQPLLANCCCLGAANSYHFTLTSIAFSINKTLKTLNYMLSLKVNCGFDSSLTTRGHP